MELLKRFLPRLITLAVVCAISLFGAVRQQTVQTTAAVQTRPTVIIDAGHGGFDGGAVANDGTVEKDINLSISLKVCELLRFNGYEVMMTRTEDTGTEDDSSGKISARKVSDLKNRLELMNSNPDAVFVSIHLNKFTTSAANGAQVFYSPNTDASGILGESIQSSVISMLQPENTRVIKRGTSSTYLLHKAQIPAVIVECGFLSNSAELKRLKEEDYQSKMAFCVAVGIIKFFEEKEDNNGIQSKNAVRLQ